MSGNTRKEKATLRKNRLFQKKQEKKFKELRKIKATLEGYQSKTSEKATKLALSLHTVETLSKEEGKEKEIKALAEKALKQKAYIMDYTEKAAKKFSQVVHIVSKYGSTDTAITLYQANQDVYRAIETHQTTALTQVERIEQLLVQAIGVKAGEALQRLEEAMPSPAGYYIFQKEVCHVEKLSEEQVIQLAKDGTIQLKKITKQQFTGLTVMAKWPKGWFDSPLNFLQNIFKAKFEGHAEFSTSRKSTTKATDGYMDEFGMEFKAVADVIIQVSQIVLEASIKGSIDIMVGHNGSLGTFLLKAEGCIEAAAWARANLKSLNASVGVAASVSVESTIGFESQEKEIGGKKLSFDLNAVFKAYGKAQAVAAAGAMMLAKNENVGDEEVIGEYANANKKELGEKAVEGTLGVAAGAWAGVGVAVELIGSVNCTINGIKTKLISIGQEFHIEFGIGGKVDINLQHSTEIDDATGNKYDQEALTIGLTCLAGAEFVTTVSIWKELYKKTFEALKDFSLKETKAYMKPHIKECRSKAKGILAELIGTAIKQEAQRILHSIEEGWDVSKFKHKMMTVMDKLGAHELALDSKIKEHHLNLEREKRRLKATKEKLTVLIANKKAALKEYDNIKNRYKHLQSLDEEDFKLELEKYFSEIKVLFKDSAFGDEILEAAKAENEKKNALLLLQSRAIEACTTLATAIKKHKLKVESLQHKLTKAKELTQKYNDYLDKHYKTHINHASNKLKKIDATLSKVEGKQLEDKQKQTIEKRIKAITEDIRLINVINGNKELLLKEASSEEYVSKQLYLAMENSHQELQKEQRELINSIQELFLNLSKTGF